MTLKYPDQRARGAESRTGPLWTWGWIIFWGIAAFVALADVSPAKARFLANQGFDARTLADGSNRSVDILLYGPYAAVGLRF